MLDINGLFDDGYYLAKNPDVAQAVLSGIFNGGLQHFQQFGQFEQRNPSALFNTSFYLETYTDVKAAVESRQTTAIQHFINFGSLEGRDPITEYDNSYYLAKNPDVAAAVSATAGQPNLFTGIEHFLKFGRFEGRDPNPLFKTSFYLDRNPDVAAAVRNKQITAFDHFVQFGVPEGRFPTQAFQVLDTLLVGNTRGNNVLRFDPNTGAFLGEVIAPQSGGLFAPDTLLYGPDGNGDGIPDLYISSGDKPATSKEVGASAILRYDGVTGQFIDVFVGDNPNTSNVDETGGLFRPYGMAFGSDGNLYVSSFLSDRILRYNGQTGQFIDIFATGNQQPGGLNGPNGLLFGADSSLYVTTQGSIARNGEPDFSAGLPSQVLRYNIQTRQSTIFATPTPSPESFGFVSLLGMAFSPQDGSLYVSDFANDIRRYNVQTGALLSTISTNYTGTSPSSNFIGGLAFAPDGSLFTVGFDNRESANNIGAILRYDGTTGQPLPSAGNTGAIFIAPSSRLNRPIGLTFFSGLI